MNLLIALAIVIFFIQYLSLGMNILFEEITKKELKKYAIPFIGLLFKLKKQIDKLKDE